MYNVEINNDDSKTFVYLGTKLRENNFELVYYPDQQMHYIYIYIYKVKLSRYSPEVAQRVSRRVALLFHDRGTRRE